MTQEFLVIYILQQFPQIYPQNSIRYHGVIIWNKILTAAINPDSSEVSFKIMLKKGIQHAVITHSY